MASTPSMAKLTSRETPLLDTWVAVSVSGAAGQKKSVDVPQGGSAASWKK